MKTLNPSPTPKMHLDFGAIFKSTKQFIDTYNRKQSNLTDKLNANHRATAELIVRLYAQQINKSGHAVVALADLPGFRSYNPSLASCKGCTVRTIINHKHRLVKAGFITKEIHRGADGIELRINPEVLGEVKVSTTTDDNTTQISPLASFFKGRVKNLHPLVHVQQELNNNNSTVDKLITPEKGKEVAISSATRTPQEQNKNMRESATSAPKDQTKVAGVGRTFLLSLVEQFWKYTKGRLYPKLILTEPEEKEILNHIWRTVYKKFKLDGDREQWENYQQILFARVDMVHRWLERNPKHWVPAPHLYFHLNNTKNGFEKTWVWYLKQQTLKKEIRNQLILQSTDHEWKQHAKGQGRHRHKTRFELFRLQQKRLSRYKDADLLKSYEDRLQHNLTSL